MKDPTPPPWLIEVGSGGFLAVTDKDGNVIARLDEDEYANANLISAVHELKAYAECRMTMDRYGKEKGFAIRDLEASLAPLGFDPTIHCVRNFAESLREKAFAKIRGETP